MSASGDDAEDGRGRLFAQRRRDEARGDLPQGEPRPVADPVRAGPARVTAGAYVARTPWSAAEAVAVGFAIVIASVAGAKGVMWLLARAVELPAGQGALGPLAVVWMAVNQAIMIGLTLAVSATRGGRVREVLALGPARGGAWDYVVAFGVMIGLLGLLNVALVLLVQHDLFADLRGFGGIMQHPLWWLAMIVLGIGAPLSEELLFRGFLQSALTRSALRFGGAAVITTVLWTALHVGYSLIGILEVGLIGLLFAWMLRRSGSLRVPLFCHALYNMSLALLLKFGPQGL